jgi:hypothetical protein
VIDVQQVDVWVKVFGGYAKEEDVINNVSADAGSPGCNTTQVDTMQFGVC